MALSQGVVINKRYEIITPIKSGGMGAVYKAYDLHFEKRIVAIKEMLQSFSSPDTYELVRRKFKEEANILVTLSHPGIPQVIDYMLEKEVSYIVMEFIDGQSLDQLLDEYLAFSGKPMPEDLAVKYAIQLCDILHYLHNQKPLPIIHRDIKPGNIILRKERQEVALVDFGLARAFDQETVSTHTLVGTVGYAPLEQFKGRPEIRSDIYALGATMHHLISGKRPAPLAIDPLEEVYPEAHGNLARIVNKATSEELDERFATASEMKDALLAYTWEMPALKSTEMLAKLNGDRASGDTRLTEQIKPAARTKIGPKDKKTYLDETLDERIERFEHEKADSSGARAEKRRNAAMPVVKIAVAFVVALLLSCIGVFWGSAVKASPFGIFEKADRRQATKDFTLLEASRKRFRSAHDGPGDYIELRKTKSPEVSGELREKASYSNRGIIFRANKPISMKRATFVLDINGNPNFLIAFGEYGLRFTDAESGYRAKFMDGLHWELAQRFGLSMKDLGIEKMVKSLPIQSKDDTLEGKYEITWADSKMCVKINNIDLPARSDEIKPRPISYFGIIMFNKIVPKLAKADPEATEYVRISNLHLEYE